ncbi:MAG: DUF1501 domain-containing protein [Verrucomicrobiales bacterium]|nr:DUF1501 domain-containing protein [Verrucomicrobiales bacterium]
MKPISIATRRDFLTRGLGIAGIGMTLPNFLLRPSLAAAPASGDKVVVSLLLTGGPDGLAVAPPFANDAYYNHRKVLAIKPGEVIKVNDQIGLHPMLTGFKSLLDQGQMAMVLGTGYPNFNLSHFSGRHIWEAAQEGMPDVAGPAHTGWLGRFVDSACKNNPDPALNVAVGGGNLPLIIKGKDHLGIGFTSPDSFKFLGDRTKQGQEVYGKLNQPSGEMKEMKENLTADDLQFITRTAVNANEASVRLGDLAAKYQTPVAYPDTDFGVSVKTIAGFINGGLSARAYYAAQGIAVFGGYDTHADQPRRLSQLLDELSQTVTAFYKDLARCGNEKRVLTFTYSEFGRRVHENQSGGTDHGLAQPMFLFGSGIKPGVHGTQPSLTDLDERGNLKMTTDFRSVYAAILEKWLGIPHDSVLGQKFPLMDCMA